MATKSPEAFIRETMGNSYDVDNFPQPNKWQCWDYVSGVYFPYIGGKAIHCSQTGYVKDIAFGKNWNGILDFCDDVGLHEELKIGDVCIWNNCPACPWSHIAIYYYDHGQYDVHFAGQNQPAPYVTNEPISVVGIIGVFRPKIFADHKEDDKDQDTHKPTKDQFLTRGSLVVSATFKIEKIDAAKNLGYSRAVGGWFPLDDVDEVDAIDGALDQVVHVGSSVKFNKGVMRVTGFAYGNIVSVDKLGYLINADCLIEIEG